MADPGSRARALREPQAIVAVAAPDPWAGALAPEQPRSPELEARWQHALIVWKRDVEQIFDTCGPRDSKARAPALLTVSFEAMPRSPDDDQQVVAPSWLQIEPSALAWLDDDEDAAVLEGCLARVRATAMTVPLVGDERRRKVAASAEHLLVQI